MNILSFDVGIRHLAYCLLHVPIASHAPSVPLSDVHILKWGILSLLDDGVKVSKKIGLDTYCKAMYQQCEATFSDIPDVHVVAIENQPALRNPVMKSIQMMLYSYFSYKKHLDASWSQLHTIKLMSASSKWKCALAPTRTGHEQTYKDGKQLSVSTTLAYLQGNLIAQGSQWAEWLQPYKKKDDLCDAFLQGLIYVRVNESKKVTGWPDNEPRKITPI